MAGTKFTVTCNACGSTDITSFIDLDYDNDYVTVYDCRKCGNGS